MVQLMPLHPTLASFKSKLALPFWYQLIQVVLEKRPQNRCSYSSSRAIGYLIYPELIFHLTRVSNLKAISYRPSQCGLMLKVAASDNVTASGSLSFCPAFYPFQTFTEIPPQNSGIIPQTDARAQQTTDTPPCSTQVNRLRRLHLFVIVLFNEMEAVSPLDGHL